MQFDMISSKVFHVRYCLVNLWENYSNWNLLIEAIRIKHTILLSMNFVVGFYEGNMNSFFEVAWW
jgi:hypothetical protein